MESEGERGQPVITGTLLEGSVSTPESNQGRTTMSRKQIIVPLGMDETSEWCNSFVLVLKANSKR